MYFFLITPETFPDIKVPIILNKPIKVSPVAAIVVSKPLIFAKTGR